MEANDIISTVVTGVLALKVLLDIASFFWNVYRSRQQPFFLVHKPRSSEHISDAQEATSCWGKLATCFDRFCRFSEVPDAVTAAAQSPTNTGEAQEAVGSEQDGQAEPQPPRATPKLHTLYFSPPSLWSYVLELIGMQGWTALSITIYNFLTLFAANKVGFVSRISPEWYRLFKFIVVAFPTLTLWVMIWQHAEVVLRKFLCKLPGLLQYFIVLPATTWLLFFELQFMSHCETTMPSIGASFKSSMAMAYNCHHRVEQCF